MNEVKRVFLVSLIITSNKDGIRSNVQTLAYTESDARKAVEVFGKRHDDGSVLFDWSQTVTGNLPDGDGDDKLMFHGSYRQVEVETVELEDAYRSYEVEVEVTRKWTLLVNIDEGESEDDAESKARQRIEDGDENWQMDCPDDEEIEILMTTED